MRTYTVVGVASALFVLISKYGFTDVLRPGQVVLDPSRVAAQIVSRLGFIGAGIIFVRRGSVRGLTTAASIWLTAAIGAAAGAGLIVLAVIGTAGYFLAISVLPPMARVIARRSGRTWPLLRVSYLERQGMLRQILAEVTGGGFLVADLETTHHDGDSGGRAGSERSESEGSSVEVRLQLGGRGDLESLIVALSELDGILTVATVDEA